MHQRSCLTVILAAGEGTRMKSSRPKVLHELAGRPLLAHVMETARAAAGEAVAVVLGPEAQEIRAALAGQEPEHRVFEQKERLGTGHAVLQARAAIGTDHDELLVLFADTPLVSVETLERARQAIAGGAAIAVVGFHADDPAGYGRLVVRDGQLEAIREDRDCTDQERKITFCNSGLMAFDGRRALALLERIGRENAKGEYYLTDAVQLAREARLAVVAVEGDQQELMGVNTQAELARAEALWQMGKRNEALAAGACMQAPETVHFSFDTELGPDCRIEPNVWFGPGVKLGKGVRIRAFSHIEGATIQDGAEVRPFARLRPGARLGRRSKVGNFCEVKQADLGEGAKVNHLTYIGDATIGTGANVGAGTITCNYDGFNKYRTEIGAGAFIGSNSALVAPVRIGGNAIVAAGSVITRDVPDEALAFGRARQVIMQGRAAELNALNAAVKAGKN